MDEGLCVLVGDVVTKVCVVTCVYSVGVHGEYVVMFIYVICWLSWCIFVRSEVISTSLAQI